MADDPFKRIKKELDRARAQFLRELDRLERELRRAMKPASAAIHDRLELGDPLAAATAEFRVELRNARNAAEAERRNQDYQRQRRRNRRRRPPDDGGELAPVKPRPNPTPLVGGAEAPLE